MKNRLVTLQDKLSASYWFIPALMAALAVILSVASIKLDEGIGRDLRWVTGLVYVDSPEGARAVLSTVASSMITVAGVVFSLTMVVLSLTSQQFGPLVLAHFMRDRGNQFVLGVFTATFIYCLLVLRTIRGVENSTFIPHLSVLTGLGLAIASLAVLIYFIHHVSQSIQAPEVIARINVELMDKIDDLFPARVGREVSLPDVEAARQALLQRFERESYPIDTRKSGYLQMLDVDSLLTTARDHHLVVKLEALPGQFLFKGQTLVRVLSLGQDSDDVGDEIQDAFIVGSRRTRTQDIEFIFTQLSALAVRALSPALNDPYTAIMVIDHLGEALCAVLQRQQPSMYRYDEDNQLRVIAASVTFETLFHTAFDQIRHYGHSDPKVDIRLLHVLKALWTYADKPADRDLLRRYAAHLYQEGQDRLTNSEDERLRQAYMEILQQFQAREAGP